MDKKLADVSRLLERLEQAETHYAILSVDPRADSSEIVAAYRQTVIAVTRAFNDLRDTVPGGQLQGFKAALARVRQAYNVLGTPAIRADYDIHLSEHAPAEPETLTGFEILAGDIIEPAIDASMARGPAATDCAGAPPVSSTPPALNRRPDYDEHVADIDDRNRRRSDRTGLGLMGRVTRTDEHGQKLQEMVKTLEVSKSGASFLTRYSPKVGNVLHLALPMPLSLRLHGHAESAYSTYALVRRVRPFDDDHKLVAVEFIGARPPKQYQDRPAALFNVDNWTGPDRRRSPRVDRQEIVALRFLNESAEVIGLSLGTTENVGRRGARIRLETPAPEFHMVRIMCGGVGFESLAALCRSYRGPDTRQRLCVNFTENEWAVG
jgi:curved DNA-binding protein CbpA